MPDDRISEARLDFVKLNVSTCFLCKKPLDQGDEMLCFLAIPKKYAHRACGSLPLWKWFVDPSEVVEIPPVAN
jgi:hypothetical protein